MRIGVAFLLVLALAPAARPGSPRLVDPQLSGRGRVRVLDARRPARPRRRTAGSCGSQVAASRTWTPRAASSLPHRGPGQPGVPLARASSGASPGAGGRLVSLDQRGTGSSVLGLPGAPAPMGSSDLTPPAPATVEACAEALGTGAASSAPPTPSPTSSSPRALGAESCRSTASPTGPTSPSATRSRIPERVERLVLDSVVPQTAATTRPGRIPRDHARPRLRLRRRFLRRRPRGGDPRRHDGPALLDR